MTRLSFALVALAAALAGCAPVPRPQILDEVDEVARSPAAQDAKERAEPTWARAEKRRLEAHEAATSDLASHAQFLAEESIATYAEGASLARVARAALRETAAQAEAARLEKELADTEAELARAVADVDALGVRLRAAEDRAASKGSGDPARSKAAARGAASAALGDAGLLCASARLLGAGSGDPGKPEDPQSPAALRRDLDAAEASIQALERALRAEDGGEKKKADAKPAQGGDKGAKPAPAGEDTLAQADAARASCLSVLERTRAAAAKKTSGGGAPARPDALLGELSAMFASQRALDAVPSRDERGVSVTLPKPWDGAKLSDAARARLATLDRVASAHSAYPVAIVVHAGKPLAEKERAAWEARGAAVASELSSVSASRRVVVVGREERAGAERVEVVFIAPESL